jgi:uncharacterized repeat protein (TIGR03803 family)
MLMVFASQRKFVLIAVLGSFLPSSSFAGSRTQTVVWNFSNRNGDGAYPAQNSVISDVEGNLYGVTVDGGGYTSCQNGCGIAFELSPNGSGGYEETILHDFTGTDGDGANPYGGLVLNQDGNLYGTTLAGGINGTGTVYELSVSGGDWTETILYSFGAVGSSDAEGPQSGLVLDSTGNLYGTAGGGGAANGACDCGTIFELTPSGDTWTETILHRFRGAGGLYNGDGSGPNGLTFDAVGDLYGSTAAGGNQRQNYGTVFRLKRTSSGWAYKVLYSFTGPETGFRPEGNVVVDKAGRIYGTCYEGGGTVWELTKSGTTFALQVLHDFSVDGSGPGGIAMDASRNIFGATQGSSNTFYKLSKSGNAWSETVLHTFTGGADGADPSLGTPLLEPNGNIFGLADGGGTYGYGVAFENVP